MQTATDGGRASIQIGGCFANTLKINVFLLAAAYYSKMTFLCKKEEKEKRGKEEGAAAWLEQVLGWGCLLLRPLLEGAQGSEYSPHLQLKCPCPFAQRYSAHLHAPYIGCASFLRAGRLWSPFIKSQPKYNDDN